MIERAGLSGSVEGEWSSQVGFFPRARQSDRRGLAGEWVRVSRWAVGSALVAWTMANLLDLFSVWLMVQAGGRWPWARHHPAESFVIYGLLRLLLTMAVPLGVASASRFWPWLARAFWGALTLFALATAAAAWWRLYR